MKKSIFIFLFALFLILAFYILIQGAGIYTSSKSYAEAQTKESLCAVFFDFELKNATYESNLLSFRLLRKSETGEPFSYLIILTDIGDEKKLPVLNMLSHKEQLLNTEINISKNFTVYPESCRTKGKSITIS